MCNTELHNLKHDMTAHGCQLAKQYHTISGLWAYRYKSKKKMLHSDEPIFTVLYKKEEKTENGSP